MLNVINQAGILGWPMALIALGNIYLIVKYGIKLFGSKKSNNVDLNNIIFLGGFALSLGIFSHYLGLYEGLQIYSYLSAEQVAGGYATSLIALLLGFVIFIVSGIFWFSLRIKLNSNSLEVSK
ncbi:MAG: hypothetical protein AB7T22_17300 [Calditrichaceae bacterium]